MLIPKYYEDRDEISDAGKEKVKSIEIVLPLVCRRRISRMVLLFNISPKRSGKFLQE